MKKTFLLLTLSLLTLSLQAEQLPFGKGTLEWNYLANNAVRIKYKEKKSNQNLPEWLYVSDKTTQHDISVEVDQARKIVFVKNKLGQTVFTATSHQWENGKATLSIASPTDEFLFGLGQFQDGYSNIRGLSRRLTQVNTQISIPMMISNKGYGLLWNNYGLTEFNPSHQQVSSPFTL